MRIRILLFSSLTFKMPTKNEFLKKSFSAQYFLKVLLQHFSKIKVKKKSQNCINQGFSYYFCLMIEGSGSGSIPLTNGSGSMRPKNMWIRIRDTDIMNDPLASPDYLPSSSSVSGASQWLNSRISSSVMCGEPSINSANLQD